MGYYKRLLIEKEEKARLAALRKEAKQKEAEERAWRVQRRKQARTEQELYDLAVAWGYKNPEFWAKKVWNGRKKL